MPVVFTIKMGLYTPKEKLNKLKQLMKKLVTILLVLSISLSSCASAFGKPGNQSDKQRKNDKVFSRTLLGVLALSAITFVATRQ